MCSPLKHSSALTSSAAPVPSLSSVATPLIMPGLF